MPSELYEGMVRFELESNDYFDALVLMDENYKKSHQVDYAYALSGFNVSNDVAPLLAGSKKKVNDFTSRDHFNIGKIQYQSDECVPALKSFKKLKNKLSLEYKQQWAFYRSNCFIKLGSNKRSAQVLTDILGGVWASYAYFNLAMSYAEGSRDKTKALIALRVAESLNAGKTREEKSLNDRINLAAGALYLEGGKPGLAVDFFKKVHLDSDTAPKALYLNGLSQLELGDFRSATQSWSSAKTYPLVQQSVAESLLAIPFAYERSGYVSQALEAYLEASSGFEDELDIIDKIDSLLEKYGAQKILIEESEIAGLEWFLAKDVVTNTARASYYNYFMQDAEIYDSVELHSELTMLLDSLEFWSSQLVVFDRSLDDKQKNFKQKSKTFDASSVRKEIEKHRSDIVRIKASSEISPAKAKSLQLQAMTNSIGTLKSRLSSLQDKIKKGKGSLSVQLKKISELSKRIDHVQRRLSDLIGALDKQITEMVRTRLGKLRREMLSNFERAEQGLTHIFEGIAESKQMRKKNLLDGRYK